jgi:hypothetical protein
MPLASMNQKFTHNQLNLFIRYHHLPNKKSFDPSFDSVNNVATQTHEMNEIVDGETVTNLPDAG